MTLEKGNDMIEIRNTEIFGLDRTIKASGNSFAIGDIDTLTPIDDKDVNRATKLGSSTLPHQSHDSYLKGVVVQFDIKYPQYWSMEFQRYNFVDIIMSTSKMHRLSKNANLDFNEFKKQFNKYVTTQNILNIQSLAKDYENAEGKDAKYEAFMKLVSNLPMGYELWMTVSTNYLQLKTIFTQRKNHKLKEDWGEFCKWCVSLPRFTELTGCTLD